ncbi:MAG: thiol-disulfide oxidoreductase DCC family protein [Lewinellaceae bacterium]|nr:thiol-disulfide oxidoreductase DCC family protein [Lewinellaceae bacterium]
MDLSSIPSNQSIILFDGVCNLCNGFVQFIIQRDPKRRFRYASLQSETGQSLLREVGLPADEINTVVLIEGKKGYTHSDVALRVARRMGGLWPVFTVFYVIPRPVRNAVYNWVARNRYRWFGKREACMVPTPELKSLFLD